MTAEHGQLVADLRVPGRPPKTCFGSWSLRLSFEVAAPGMCAELLGWVYRMYELMM